MGASGSGKSTLLYALSGMEHIDEGKVRFEDKDLSKISDKELSDLRRNKIVFADETTGTLNSKSSEEICSRNKSVYLLTAK